MTQKSEPLRELSGHIDRITDDGIDCAFASPGGYINRIATVPVEMFPEAERGTLRRGTYVTARVDDTELVVSICRTPSLRWTKEEINAAKAIGALRAAAIKWEQMDGQPLPSPPSAARPKGTTA